MNVSQSKVFDLQRKFSRSLIQATDDERRSLAMDLHDGIAQNLLALKSQLNRGDSGELKQKAQLHIKQSLQELRNIARNMHPHQLETLGLNKTIEAAFDEALTPLGIKTEFDLAATKKTVSKNTELQMFRIAQECLNNIVKHAHAKQVSVQLSEVDNSLVLSISDDGTGNPSEFIDGMGMINMRERAAIISASLSLNPASNGGTVVTLEVPT